MLCESHIKTTAILFFVSSFRNNTFLYVVFVSDLPTDRLSNWSERLSLETAARGPAIIKKQQILPLLFQNNINFTIGNTVYITNATKSLTILCPAEGFPSPKISWAKDGVLLQRTSR